MAESIQDIGNLVQKIVNQLKSITVGDAEAGKTNIQSIIASIKSPITSAINSYLNMFATPAKQIPNEAYGKWKVELDNLQKQYADELAKADGDAKKAVKDKYTNPVKGKITQKKAEQPDKNIPDPNHKGISTSEQLALWQKQITQQSSVLNGKIDPIIKAINNGLGGSVESIDVLQSNLSKTIDKLKALDRDEESTGEGDSKVVTTQAGVLQQVRQAIDAVKKTETITKQFVNLFAGQVAPNENDPKVKKRIADIQKELYNAAVEKWKKTPDDKKKGKSEPKEEDFAKAAVAKLKSTSTSQEYLDSLDARIGKQSKTLETIPTLIRHINTSLINIVNSVDKTNNEGSPLTESLCESVKKLYHVVPVLDDAGVAKVNSKGKPVMDQRGWIGDASYAISTIKKVEPVFKTYAGAFYKAAYQAKTDDELKATAEKLAKSNAEANEKAKKAAAEDETKKYKPKETDANKIYADLVKQNNEKIENGAEQKASEVLGEYNTKIADTVKGLAFIPGIIRNINGALTPILKEVENANILGDISTKQLSDILDKLYKEEKDGTNTVKSGWIQDVTDCIQRFKKLDGIFKSFTGLFFTAATVDTVSADMENKRLVAEARERWMAQFGSLDGFDEEVYKTAIAQPKEAAKYADQNLAIISGNVDRTIEGLHLIKPMIKKIGDTIGGILGDVKGDGEISEGIFEPITKYKDKLDKFSNKDKNAPGIIENAVSVINKIKEVAKIPNTMISLFATAAKDVSAEQRKEAAVKKAKKAVDKFLAEHNDKKPEELDEPDKTQLAELEKAVEDAENGEYEAIVQKAVTTERQIINWESRMVEMNKQFRTHMPVMINNVAEIVRMFVGDETVHSVLERFDELHANAIGTLVDKTEVILENGKVKKDDNGKELTQVVSKSFLTKGLEVIGAIKKIAGIPAGIITAADSVNKALQATEEVKENDKVVKAAKMSFGDAVQFIRKTSNAKSSVLATAMNTVSIVDANIKTLWSQFEGKHGKHETWKVKNKEGEEEQANAPFAQEIAHVLGVLKALTDLCKIPQAVQKAADALEKADFGKVRDNLAYIQDRSRELAKDLGPGLTITAKNICSIAVPEDLEKAIKQVSNLNDAMGMLATIMETIITTGDRLAVAGYKRVIKATFNIEFFVEMYGEMINEVADSMNDLPDSDVVNHMVDEIQSKTKGTGEFIDRVVMISDKIEKISELSPRRTRRQLGRAKSNIISTMQHVVNTIKETAIESDRLDGTEAEKTKVLTDLFAPLKTITDIYKYIVEFEVGGKEGISNRQVRRNMNRIRTQIQVINTFMTQICQDLNSMSDQSIDPGKSSKNIQAIANVMDNIVQILETINDVALGALASRITTRILLRAWMGDSKKNDGVYNLVRTITTTLTELGSDEQTAKKNVKSIQKTVDFVKEIFGTINSAITAAAAIRTSAKVMTAAIDLIIKSIIPKLIELARRLDAMGIPRNAHTKVRVIATIIIKMAQLAAMTVILAPIFGLGIIALGAISLATIVLVKEINQIITNLNKIRNLKGTYRTILGTFLMLRAIGMLILTATILVPIYAAGIIALGIIALLMIPIVFEINAIIRSLNNLTDPGKPTRRLLLTILSLIYIGGLILISALLLPIYAAGTLVLGIMLGAITIIVPMINFIIKRLEGLMNPSKPVRKLDEIIWTLVLIGALIFVSTVLLPIYVVGAVVMGVMALILMGLVPVINVSINALNRLVSPGKPVIKLMLIVNSMLLISALILISTALLPVFALGAVVMGVMALATLGIVFSLNTAVGAMGRIKNPVKAGIKIALIIQTFALVSLLIIALTLLAPIYVVGVVVMALIAMSVVAIAFLINVMTRMVNKLLSPKIVLVLLAVIGVLAIIAIVGIELAVISLLALVVMKNIMPLIVMIGVIIGIIAILALIGFVAPYVLPLIGLAVLVFVAVAIASLALFATIACLWLLQQITLDPELIKANVSLVLSTALGIIGMIFSSDIEDPMGQKAEDHGVLAAVGGGLAKIIGILAACVVLVITFIAVVAIFLIALILRWLAEIDPKKLDQGVENARKVIAAAASVISMIFASDDANSDSSNRGILGSILHYICPGLAAILQAIFAVAYLAVMVVAIAMILLVASMLRLLAEIDPAKLEQGVENARIAVQCARDIIDMIFANDEANTSASGRNKGLFDYVFDMLGLTGIKRIIDALMSVAFLAVTLLAVWLVRCVADELVKIADIDTQKIQTAAAKTVEIMNCARSVINAVMAPNDNKINKGESWLTKLLKWVLPEGAIQFAEVLASVGKLAMMTFAIGAVFKLGEQLNKIVSYSFNAPTVTTKTNSIFNAGNAIVDKIKAQGKMDEATIESITNSSETIEEITRVIPRINRLASNIVSVAAWKMDEVRQGHINSLEIMNCLNEQVETISASKIIPRNVNEKIDSMERMNRLIKSYTSVSGQDVRNSKELTSNYIKFLDRVNSMDATKLKTTEQLMKHWAVLATKINGNFEGLATSINEHIMPALEQLNTTMDQVTQVQKQIIDDLAKPVSIQGPGGGVGGDSTIVDGAQGSTPGGDNTPGTVNNTDISDTNTATVTGNRNTTTNRNSTTNNRNTSTADNASASASRSGRGKTKGEIPPEYRKITAEIVVDKIIKIE